MCEMGVKFYQQSDIYIGLFTSPNIFVSKTHVIMEKEITQIYKSGEEYRMIDWGGLTMPCIK